MQETVWHSKKNAALYLNHLETKGLNRHEWKGFFKKKHTSQLSLKIVPWVRKDSHYALQSSKKIRRAKEKWSQLKMSTEETQYKQKKKKDVILP